MKTNSIVVPAVALGLICLVATLLLAFTDSLTRARIEAIQREAADSARKLVVSDASSFEKDESFNDADVYKALDASGNIIGYAVTVSGKSYGGDIEVMTGFDTEGVILGTEVLEINDTPSLGMNAKKEYFRIQFAGLRGGDLVVSKNASLGEIQALTGATISSKAYTECVNKAHDIVFPEGGKN